MLQTIENDIKNIISKLFNIDCSGKITLDIPPEKFAKSCDISTNIAMVIAKEVKKSPKEIAEKIAEALKKLDYIKDVEIANPAFLNIKLNGKLIIQTISDVLKNGDKNLVKNIGNGEKVNVEFCSANPTGPLHIGHARGTIFGDVMASMLEKSGYNITREYYINDAGGQIDTLLKSVEYRINGEVPPDGCYPGEYIIDLAKKYKSPNELSRKSVVQNVLDNFILPTLSKMKVKYDVFTSEQKLKDEGCIEKSIEYLKSKELIYNGILEQPKGQKVEDWEPREQMLFKSKQFGDDTDRPLAKSDGSHTYFASDIAYHYDKFKRGFTKMLVILGADHKGYVKRLTSAVMAVSDNMASVDVKLCELVNFMKHGEMVKMSKRKGNFLTIDDVIDQIDINILRFIILTRKADTVINFDIELAKEQSKDNPIWYIQYAYSRCNSVLEKAKALGLEPNIDGDVENYELPDEYSKLIVFAGFYTRFLELAVKNSEPYFFVSYLINLATLFHSLWSAGDENKALRFIKEDNKQQTSIRLAVVKTVQNLIKSGLEMLNIDVIGRM